MIKVFNPIWFITVQITWYIDWLEIDTKVHLTLKVKEIKKNLERVRKVIGVDEII